MSAINVPTTSCHAGSRGQKKKKEYNDYYGNEINKAYAVVLCLAGWEGWDVEHCMYGIEAGRRNRLVETALLPSD